MWFIVSWAIFAAALAWPAWFAARQVWRWRRRRSHCESCGYSLHARVSDICPECGHDVVSPSRLIDPRRMALHTTIVLELLVASHLFYRLEAIQKRGWIAALPTTLLIMRFSVDEPASARRWSVSPLRRELAFRTRNLDTLADPTLRVDSDVAARWQERWLIAKAMRIDYGPQLQTEDWQIPAARVLNAAWERDLLTPAQRSRLSCMCFVSISTREQWPRGAPVAAVMAPRFLAHADGYRLTAHALTPGYADHEISRRSIPWMIERPAMWTLGVANEPGPVEYEITLERHDASSNTWDEVRREKRVITVVSNSTEHGLTGAPVPDAAIEALDPYVGVSPFGPRTPAIWFNVGASDGLDQALGATRFAIFVTLYQDGRKVGTGSGTWHLSNQQYGDWSTPYASRVYATMGKWAVPIKPDDGWRWNELQFMEDHDWTIVIEGDPHVALRDFESTSYWSGWHEFRNIPIAPQR